LGQRSRKRGRRGPAPATTATAVRPRPQRPSSEERNAAIRAGLTPLAPGERPIAIKISVALAAALGLTNLILFIAGVKPHVGGQHPQAFEVAVFTGLMLMCAYGMWRLRYWAVLGFQALLAIGVLGFSLALVRASSIFGALICVAVIGTGGYLFFKLVRVLSRLQLPAPPGR
jgi:hypothetical protein